MRRFAMTLLVACLLCAGCRVFDRGGPDRPPAGSPGKAGGSREPFWSEGSSGGGGGQKGPGGGSNPDEPSTDGVLAGRLVDAFDRRPNNAFLQVSLVRTDGGGGKPIGVEADQNGYFVIQGLQPGQTYTVRARSEEGERILAGEVQARPPYTRLLIRLSEDNSPAALAPSPKRERERDLEPAPPRVGTPGEDDPLLGGSRGSPPPAAIVPDPEPVPEPEPIHGPASRTIPPGTDGYPYESEQEMAPAAAGFDPWLDEHAWEPGPPPAASRGPAPDRARPSPVVPPSAPENIVRNPTFGVPPVAAIPGASDIPPPAFAPPPPRAAPTSDFGSPTAPARQRLNFTVYDPRGEPWEFRNHSGKLVLLDFWGTWCTPCLQALPKMKQLAAQYGASGLEVIGIAIEDGPWQESAANVEGVARRYGLNYPVYLEGERTKGELTAKFRVRGYPTLILLDEEGTELWRGTPDRERELRGILLRRLGH